MSAVCFLLAVIVAAVGLTGGSLFGLDLSYLWMLLTAAGLLLGSGAVGWVRSRLG